MELQEDSATGSRTCVERSAGPALFELQEDLATGSQTCVERFAGPAIFVLAISELQEDLAIGSQTCVERSAGPALFELQEDWATALCEKKMNLIFNFQGEPLMEICIL